MGIPEQRRFWTGRRLVITLVTLSCALLSVKSALTLITARAAPDFALTISPHSPAALAGKGEQTFLAALTSGKFSPLVSLAAPAKQALTGQALSPLAIRQLAYAHLASGDERLGNRLLALARKTTRRDFGVQLWSIEQAVQRNDLDGAVRGYASTMEVLDESWGILFPRLGSAIQNPEIAGKLAPYVRQGGRWVVPFLNTTLAKPGSELSLVRLMQLAGPMPREVRADGFDKTLGSVLIARGKFAPARAYYLSLPYAQPSLLQSVAVTNQSFLDRHGPFAWQMFDQMSSGAALEGDSTMSVFADDSVRGLVARKVLYLPPGVYRFSQRYQETEMPSGAFIQWELQCGDEQGTLRTAWRSEPLRPKSGTALGQNFVVPSGCSNQILSLVVAGGVDRNRTTAIVGPIGILSASETSTSVEQNQK